MKIAIKLTISFLFITLLIGCEVNSPAKLLCSIEFTETYRNQSLSLPNGSFIPDNPNFNINNPRTWTGNMAQYVNNNYLYSISLNIENIGDKTAYDAEIDIYYIYDTNEEIVETRNLGDLWSDDIISPNINIGSTNKQLIECSCEVFWYD